MGLMAFQQSLLRPYLPLIKLINKSIVSATFPYCWKSTIVTPVPKLHTGSSLPISSQYYLFFLRFWKGRYLIRSSYNLFSQRQSGFCIGHSTQDDQLHVLNSFSSTCTIDYGGYVIDCVDYSVFVAKDGLLWF